MHLMQADASLCARWNARDRFTHGQILGQISSAPQSKQCSAFSGVTRHAGVIAAVNVRESLAE